MRKTAPIAITSFQQYIAADTAGSTSPTFPFPKTLAVTTLPERKRKNAKWSLFSVLNRSFSLICR